MKATELRIGNLVKYNDGGIFKVIGIYNFGLDVEDDIEVTYMEYENFSAIPITEEWLLKFGFEKKYKNYEKGYFMFFKGSCSRISYKLSLIGINIKYVHQLQNLYFALTGEEL